MTSTVRSILHIDMDAFYASVEQRDAPELRGKPVLVGGRVRGVVLAASYEARPFGARSAMPMAQALRLCPQAIVVPPRHARYAEASEQVFAIFERYTPLVEGLSLDEAFLDVSASRALFGNAEEIARRIKQAVRSELELTASIGIAPCKFAAKIASDLGKPDGLLIVPDGDVAGFLAPLPIERMWGVGPKAAARLRADGFRTIADLADAGEERLRAVLGSWGVEVQRLARGLDEREVVPDRSARSVGSEETFERDLRRPADLERKLLKHAQEVARRLTHQGLFGQVVRIKVKYQDFTLRSRQRRLRQPVMDTDSIYETARELLREMPHGRKGIRLIGVAMSELSAGQGQAPLFPDPGDERRKRLQRVAVELRDRFGSAGLTRAALLDDPE